VTAHPGADLARPLRYSINVTLDGAAFIA